MVKFEPQFVATKFPGYFFNIQDHQLYSMKVDGILKPLKFHKPNHFNHLWRYKDTEGGYQVSVKGQKVYDCGNILTKCNLLEENCTVLKKVKKNIAMVLIPVDKSVDKWGIVWINGGNALR